MASVGLVLSRTGEWGRHVPSGLTTDFLLFQDAKDKGDGQIYIAQSKAKTVNTLHFLISHPYEGHFLAVHHDG